MNRFKIGLKIQVHHPYSSSFQKKSKSSNFQFTRKLFRQVCYEGFKLSFANHSGFIGERHAENRYH